MDELNCNYLVTLKNCRNPFTEFCLPAYIVTSHQSSTYKERARETETERKRRESTEYCEQNLAELLF